MVEKICAGLIHFGCILCNVREVVWSRCGWLFLHVFWNTVTYIPVPLGNIGYILTDSGHHLLRQACPRLNSLCSYYVLWNAHRSLLFPWWWSQQCTSSYPCVLQTLHQCTTLCLLTCLFTESVVGQWLLVCTSSTYPYSCSHRCQALNL